MKRKWITLPLVSILTVSTPLVSLISCSKQEEEDPTVEDITIDESEKQQSADFINKKAMYTFSFSGEDETAIQLEIIEPTNGSIKFDTGYDNVVVKDGKFTTVIMFDQAPSTTTDCPFSLKCKYTVGEETKEQTIEDLHIWYVKQIDIVRNVANFINDVATFNFIWRGDVPTELKPELFLVSPESGLELVSDSVQVTGDTFSVKVKRTDVVSHRFDIKFSYEIPNIGSFDEVVIGLTASDAGDPAVTFTGEDDMDGITRNLGSSYGWQSAAIYSGFTASNIADVSNDLVVTVAEKPDGSGSTHLGEIYPYIYETATNVDTPFELALFFENWNVVEGTYEMDVSISLAGTNEPLWSDTFSVTFEMSITQPADDQRTVSTRSHLEEYSATFKGFQFLHVDLSYDDKINRLVTLYDVDEGKDLKEVYDDYSIDFVYDSTQGENPDVILEVYFGFSQIKKMSINCSLTFTYHSEKVIDGSTGYKINKGI